MVNEDIDKETCTLIECDTIKDLKNFKQFLKQNFKGYHKRYGMLPIFNKSARIYASTKTHKLSSDDSININCLLFRLITDQTSTMTYKSTKVILEYLEPLCERKYTINNMLYFADMIKHLLPVPDNK